MRKAEFLSRAVVPFLAAGFALLSPASAAAQSAAPLIETSPQRPATPETRTQPDAIFTCEMIDEKRRRFPLTLRRNGFRANWIIHPDGSRTLDVERYHRFDLSSPDRRFVDMKPVENRHNVSGTAFDGPNAMRAVVQADYEVLERYREGIVNIFLSEGDTARRLTRFTGFCSTRTEPQAPGPDRKVNW